MPDEVSLKIGAQEFSGWGAVTISRAIDNAAHAFSLTAPFDPERQEIRSAFRPFGYQAASVSINGDLVLTGTLESIGPGVSGDNREINAQGRSKTGPLVECAVDIGRTQFDGLALSTIALQVCRPHGIGVLALNDTNPIKEARLEPGETGFDFLNRLAKSVGLILTCDPRGALVIRKVTGLGVPLAAIVEGDGPVMELRADYNGTGRWSRYKVLQQQDGEPEITGTAEDSGVPVYRPSVTVGAEGNASSVTDAAKWARAEALAASVRLSAKIAGWRTNTGLIWEPGQLVTVKAPGAFVTIESAFLVAEATLKLDGESGKTTELRLVLPATYSGEMPGSYPWD